MRLIDADKLIEDLKEYAENIKNIRDDGKCFLTEENVLSIIKEQPTAYDVDKVVEQIDDCQSYYVGRSNSIYKKCTVELEKVLEIVKAGGRDERNN